MRKGDRYILYDIEMTNFAYPLQLASVGMSFQLNGWSLFILK